MINSPRAFDYFVTFLIVFQITMTMFQDYQPRVDRPATRPALNDAIAVVDKITDIFYVIEAVIKVDKPLKQIVGMGLVFGQGAYFRNKWNIFEFVIALSGITDFISIDPTNSSQGLLETISVFRFELITQITKNFQVFEGFCQATDHPQSFSQIPSKS
jgi:hypothetical protein